MLARDFCFWLQGYFEVANPHELTAGQLTLIKRHLNLVFKHEIDPSMPDPTGALQAIHDGFPLVEPKFTPANTGSSSQILRC